MVILPEERRIQPENRTHDGFVMPDDGFVIRAGCRDRAARQGGARSLSSTLSTVFRSAWRAMPRSRPRLPGPTPSAARLPGRGRREQVVREHGEPFDLARHRSFVGAAEPRAVGGVDHDRLSTHRQVAIARAVDVRLADECWVVRRFR